MTTALRRRSSSFGTRCRGVRESPREAGIGLVEIMVAVLLLGILLGAVAPLLINGIRTSAKMTTIATATRDASQALESARSRSTTCALAEGLASDTTFTPKTITDARGLAMIRTVTISSSGAGANFQARCGASHLVQVQVSVTAATTTVMFQAGQEIASASTSVFVP